jgi:hypothetical protein
LDGYRIELAKHWRSATHHSIDCVRYEEGKEVVRWTVWELPKTNEAALSRLLPLLSAAASFLTAGGRVEDLEAMILMFAPAEPFHWPGLNHVRTIVDTRSYHIFQEPDTTNYLVILEGEASEARTIEDIEDVLNGTIEFIPKVDPVAVQDEDIEALLDEDNPDVEFHGTPDDLQSLLDTYRARERGL